MMGKKVVAVYAILFVISLISASAAAEELKWMLLKDGSVPNEVRSILVKCEKKDEYADCIIIGSKIWKPYDPHSPYTVGAKPGTCLVENEISHVKAQYTLDKSIFLANEGPTFSMCSTHLVTTIDFGQKTYTLRIFSDVTANSKGGPPCEGMTDRTYHYVEAPFMGPGVDLSCSAIKPILPGWTP